MISVQAQDLTEHQWKIYTQFEIDLYRRYYPGDKYTEQDWENMRRKIFSDLELLSEDFLNHHVFFENEIAVGFLGIRLVGDGAEFVIDALYDTLPENFIRSVFKIVKRFMRDKNKTDINSYSRREAIIDALKKEGGIIIDRKIFARIMRQDMNVIELNKIVKSVSERINYKLVLYDTIHEEILDRYVDIYNEAREDMNKYNPDKPVIIKRTREDVLKKLRWDKGPNDKMFMYMLFDNDKIAAFCSLFIREENKHMIDQAGGLTTVGRNYRGQNLARFLKAKIYLKMLEVYPDFEFIRTDTYPWNKYMYRINEEMGFRAYEVYSEIRFSYEDIIE
ncbi:MAG TPA: hypothetical protein PKC91_12765 [Ignavibacteria bacterium]|nr:hypothetical protein [Ignavibacteria bacterium]